MWFKPRRPVSTIDPAGVGISHTSPYDLDGGERITRAKTGYDSWPYPPLIGAVSGLLRQMDQSIWSGMFKRYPYGPGSTTVPLNLQNQVTIPGLAKMGN